jgi:catechol 2,3-dioxygenase-like lactoylglutathione lyase family enzyme
MKFELFVVRVFVTDWERAVRFYTETLGIPTTFRSDEMGWAQLDTGAANLALSAAIIRA